MASTFIGAVMRFFRGISLRGFRRVDFLILCLSSFPRLRRHPHNVLLFFLFLRLHFFLSLGLFLHVCFFRICLAFPPPAVESILYTMSFTHLPLLCDWTGKMYFLRQATCLGELADHKKTLPLRQQDLVFHLFAERGAYYVWMKPSSCYVQYELFNMNCG